MSVPPSPPAADRRRLWDISPPVDPQSPVFPGDVPFTLTTTFGPGPVTVVALHCSGHVGAHADAPLHYLASADSTRDPDGGGPDGTTGTDGTAGTDGTDAASLDLAAYLGPARVVHAIEVGRLLGWAHLAHAARGLPPRVLVRTHRRAPRRWDPEFTAWDPGLLDRLAGLGVVLVGTDGASLDPADSTELPAHHALGRGGMHVLENLCLDSVPEGDYELIALPLRLVGADASPVRAVLREW
ncbi:MAG: cyclase family protein [Kineosporiaceae bacterium]|nr:cyclase family protein [Kineosporiaceae bacterium]